MLTLKYMVFLVPVSLQLLDSIFYQKFHYKKAVSMAQANYVHICL